FLRQPDRSACAGTHGDREHGSQPRPRVHRRLRPPEREPRRPRQGPHPADAVAPGRQGQYRLGPAGARLRSNPHQRPHQRLLADVPPHRPTHPDQPHGGRHPAERLRDVVQRHLQSDLPADRRQLHAHRVRCRAGTGPSGPSRSRAGACPRRVSRTRSAADPVGHGSGFGVRADVDHDRTPESHRQHPAAVRRRRGQGRHGESGTRGEGGERGRRHQRVLKGRGPLAHGGVRVSRHVSVRMAGALLVAVIMGTLLAACGGGTYNVTATFDDVGDLQKSGGVQVADVRVGKISSIALTKDFRAKVSMAIDKNVHIPKNSEALVRTTSLLGEKFIELRPMGAPTQSPYLANGDVVTRTQQAPELEFVADSAIELLGAVNSSDVASIIQTGAEAFGGRGPELNRLLSDLSTISGTLASRTQQLTAIIDNLDRGTQTLANGSDDLKTLLTNLATTSQILSDNRQKAIDAVQQLSRLAAV